MRAKYNDEIKREEEIKKIYADNFDKVDATEEFKDRIKESVGARANTDIRKRQIYRTAVSMAACFIMIVFIANGNKIIAAVNDIYQMFVGKLDHQFKNNASGYEIDVNKSFQIKDGLDLKIEKMVVLNDSVDIKYSLNDNEKNQTMENFATIAECILKTGKKSYILDQEMNLWTGKGYLTAVRLSDEKKDLSECKGKTVEVETTVFYGKNGKGKKIKEKKIQFSINVKDVYQTKVYDLSQGKISINGVDIDSIQKKLWYMKVEYSSDDMSIFSEGPLLIFENKEDLLWLGGGMTREGVYEKDKQRFQKARGTEYMQLDEDADKFKVYYATMKRGKIEKDEMFYEKSNNYVTIDLSKYEKSN